MGWAQWEQAASGNDGYSGVVYLLMYLFVSSDKRTPRKDHRVSPFTSPSVLLFDFISYLTFFLLHLSLLAQFYIALQPKISVPVPHHNIQSTNKYGLLSRWVYSLAREDWPGPQMASWYG